jgi:hypothetical protein
MPLTCPFTFYRRRRKKRRRKKLSMRVRRRRSIPAMVKNHNRG